MLQSKIILKLESISNKIIRFLNREQKMANDIRLNKQDFDKKIKQFYQHWEKDTSFDAFLFVMGKVSEDHSQANIKALHHWLLKYEFSETQILITKEKIVFLASSKKKTLLCDASEEYKDKIEILTKDLKSDEDVEVYKNFYSFINTQNPKVGYFVQDTNTGKFVEELLEYMPKDFNKVDATSFFEKIIIKKTDEELENLEKGAKFLDYSFKKLIDAVEEIIDDNNDTKMIEISNKIKQSLENENDKDMKTFKNTNQKIDVDNLYYNLPILIQSGGNFVYHQTAESENKPLADDTIWLSMCCEYGEVCAAAARTLKINPTPEEKEDYLLLRKAFASLFSSIKYGRKISDCYNEVYGILAKEKSEEWLSKHLGVNFGHGIGFKYEEKSLEIIPTNDTLIDENMVFFIRLYFKDLQYREKDGYGIIIGDTIVVTKGTNRNLTKHIRKNYEDISYVILKRYILKAT